MKIAFCLRNFLPGQAGGTEVYIAALSEGLQKLGVQVIVIKPGFGKLKISEYVYNSIRVLEYPESVNYTKDIITGKKIPGGTALFKQVLISEKPNIVHFHEINGSNGITIEHLRIAKSLLIPVFTTLHLTGYVCKAGTLKYKNEVECNGFIDERKCSICLLHQKGLRFGMPEMLTRFGAIAQRLNLPIDKLPQTIESGLSYPKYIRKHKEILDEIFTISEKIFVLSHWFKKVLLINNMPSEKIVLLDKALPHSLLPASKATLAPGEKELVKFVYLGRIMPIKGLHIILKALQNIELKSWSLDIYGQVGDEDYVVKCKDLARSISSAVHWKGKLDPSEVLNMLGQYSALVFPTVIEEMVGLVVMEAFAVNIPVIGSDVKGIAEQIEDGKTGILFKAGNVEALKVILEKVIEDPSILKELATNITIPVKFDSVAVSTFKTYIAALPVNATHQFKNLAKY